MAINGIHAAAEFPDWRTFLLRVGPLRKQIWFLRVGLHLALAGIPVLAISADVFGWVSMHVVAVCVLPATVLALATLVLLRPDRSDRVILAGFQWGLLACAGYDAFRLPTIYTFHWWGDFFGSVGGWATNTDSNYLVGYLWRYVGDGGGIAVAFFAIAASFRIGTSSRRTVLALGVAYGVCPVWTGLILTDLFARSGYHLFPLSPKTLILSLIGHLIYGFILGAGYWASRSLERHWPLNLSAWWAGR